MGSSSFVLVLVAATVAVSGLTACQNGGGSGGADLLVADFSNCDQKPSVGAAAVAENVGKTSWVKSPVYGKPYDRFDLEAVQNASSDSTTQYVQSLGVNVMKVTPSNMGKRCPTYNSLPTAESKFQTIWAEQSGGGTGDLQLAGLFFEYCGEGSGMACQPRTMVQPTIILNEASDRWTIVHEMMHYNFNQGRKADPDIPTRFDIARIGRTASMAFTAALADYEKLPNRGDLQKASTELRKVIDITKHLLISGPLEEVAIESLLTDQWATGALKNVGTRREVEYMKFSRERAVEAIPAEIAKEIKKIKGYADTQFWDEISAELVQTEAVLDQLIKDTDRMIEKAEVLVGKRRQADDGLLGPFGFAAIDETQTVFESVELETKWDQHMMAHDHEGVFDSLAEMQSILSR